MSCPPGKFSEPIADGNYKIVNPDDGTVLTVTQEGRPALRFVITAEWVGAPTQIWKVKTNSENGLQMIRNEEIKDNEVSKIDFEAEDESEDPMRKDGKAKKFKMTEWNLVKVDDHLGINNGFGYLSAHGKGERVDINEDCNAVQKWKFEFHSEIEKK